MGSYVRTNGYFFSIPARIRMMNLWIQGIAK
jgi:hypothetical protein